MNYLAHALLSGPEPEWVVGGFLGDHVRGDAWKNYPGEVARGIVLHRRIDSFTDRHPAFANGRSRILPPFRRYSGILLDLYFDHLLACRWARYSTTPLPQFAQSCYTLLGQYRSTLPASLQRFSSYLQQHDLLVNYADTQYLEMVLGGVSSRLKRTNPVADALPELTRNASGLADDFEQLMDDLKSFASAEWQRAGEQPR
jgi:acyl carrier protein phosphodiesterase